MTPRDIVLEQIYHRETKIIPYQLSFDYSGDIAERLDIYYGGAQWRDKIQKFFAGQSIISTMKRSPTERGAGYSRDLYGSLWRDDLVPFHLESPALPTPSFDNYQWPAPELFFMSAEEISKARQLCQARKGQVFQFVQIPWGLFETSWGIRGFENILMDIEGDIKKRIVGSHVLYCAA